MQNQLTIKKINLENLNELSELHLEIFDKEHFSTVFPKKLLVEYFDCLLSASQFRLIALNDNRLVGYLIAGYSLNNAVDKFLKKNFFKLFKLTLKNKKFILEKLLEILNRIIGKKEKSSESLRLFLIGAKRNENLKGVGQKLISEFEKELVSNGIFKYGLSVRTHNQMAIQFYVRSGFAEEFRTKKSIYYIKNLPNK